MEINNRARRDLWNEVEGLSEVSLQKKLEEDKWLIAQILDHLFLVESAFVQMVEKELEEGKDVYAKEQAVETTVDRSYKVQSPSFAVPSEKVKRLDELKHQLETSHHRMQTVFEKATKEQLLAKGIPHPAYGNLSLKQAIEFVGYHEMRHIEQIKEIKKALDL